MVNRIIPISIVFFRYIMVCKAVLAFNMGETVLASTVYKTTVCLPFFFCIAAVPNLSKLRMFLICMGKEERFLFETSDFFANSKFGSSFKLPFMNPFRLSFNIIAFSFVFVVPSFYFLIYKFRDSQNSSVPGDIDKKKDFLR